MAKSTSTPDCLCLEVILLGIIYNQSISHADILKRCKSSLVGAI